MIDLITALQLHGIFITDFNLLELRPMLNNTHGIFAAYWDGSAHYILQLSAIILFCLQYVWPHCLLNIDWKES